MGTLTLLIGLIAWNFTDIRVQQWATYCFCRTWSPFTRNDCEGQPEV